MPSVEMDKWRVGLPQNDPRRLLLLSDISSDFLIRDFIKEAEAQVDDGKVAPRMEPSQRWEIYKRFEVVIRLSAETFDLLMNGRMGYRAQYYLSLEGGRLFNRTLVDALCPLMMRSWQEREGWQLAERSLRGKDTKIWHELDDLGLLKQPTLQPEMWVENCKSTKASTIGLHLVSTNPPKIELKGTWVSERRTDTFLPAGKQCRDELLRCFGFT